MPTNLYGPGDNYHPELSHVVAALIRRFHEAKVSGAKSVIVWGTGTPRREFLYVDDMADACVHLMKTYSSAELVNIGTGEDITIASALHRPIRDTIEADLCCCVRIPAGWYRHLWPDPTGTFDLNQAGIG
jgi:nucleoside-diphosphate-sugar epimerase